MPLSPEASIALYADPTGASIEEQLWDALARNMAGGLVVDETTSLASVAAIAVSEAQSAAQETDPLAELGSTLKDKIHDAHEQTSRLVDCLGISTPSLEELASAGIDFSKLATAHETMSRLAMEPELVIAPVLTVDQWKTVYQGLQDSPVINHDVWIENGGLWVNDDIVEHWDELQTADHTVEIDGHAWQVLVLPGTPAPGIVDIEHGGNKSSGVVHPELTALIEAVAPGDEAEVMQELHPTIDSYLTLQATRLQRGDGPLDENAYTWIDGVWNDGSGGSLQAPFGYWHSAIGQVYLSWGRVDRRLDNLGVRLPVWG